MRKEDYTARLFALAAAAGIALSGCAELDLSPHSTEEEPNSQISDNSGSTTDGWDTNGRSDIDTTDLDSDIAAAKIQCTKANAAAKCGEASLCVDGYCCNSACEGTCMACDVAGREGICVVVPADADPDDECGLCAVCNGDGKNSKCVPVPLAKDPLEDCEEAPAELCGEAGWCDGNGACAQLGQGDVCGSECDGDKVVNITCDGEGVGASHCWVAAAPEDCDEHLLCNPEIDACPEACVGTQDCMEGFYCDEKGQCAAVLGTGEACANDESCASAHCADGVCCNSACEGRCEGCKVEENEGVCKRYKAGKDPDNDCAECSVCDGSGKCETLDDVAAPSGDCIDERECGHTGRCVEGACEFREAGTTCDELLCVGEENKPMVTLYQCDGKGICAELEANSCGGYRCGDSSSCLTECDDAEDCALSYSCNDHECTSDNPNGTLCLHDSECKNDHCVDGFCCDTACDGICETCGREDSEGICTKEASGAYGSRPMDDAPDCGECEVCDGEGGCRPVDTLLYPEDPTDPNNACGDRQDPSTCGLTGVCADAQGECELYRTVQHCGDDCSYPGWTVFLKHCDGNGVCVTDVESAECPGHLMCSEDGFGCLESCRNQRQCRDGYFCSLEGTCEPKKERGDACDGGVECLSGHCPEDDGVCCSEVCDEKCESCAQPGMVGLCTPVPNGEDPAGDCDDGKFCTLNDYCDGEGSCVHHGNPCDEIDSNECNDCNEVTDKCVQPAGTVCGNTANTDCTKPDSCNGSGVCLPNDIADDTTCTKDADPCSLDLCEAGDCVHPDSGNGDDDTVCNALDNCPSVTNETQSDGDEDGVGDACDACPLDPNHSEGPCLEVRMRVAGYESTVNVVFEIYNFETKAASLNGVSFRYWYTADGNFTSQTLDCYWADNNRSFPRLCGDLVTTPESAVFHAVSRNMANYYMRLAFRDGLTVAASSAATPGRSGEMQLAWHTNPYNDAVPENDYSYSNFTQMTAAPEVTLYRNDSLIWGVEP